ncbi:MAG: DUF4932 domain-containing protein [Chitinophagaceae bacterium]|nr:DUF4932 domain-containing protein [Chitinophagaceae bacterium]
MQAQLKPKVDERIELTSIINRLAGHWEYSSNDFSSYVEDVDKYFAAFKDHPVITFMKKLRNERGVSFDAIPSIATRLNPAPLLTPRFDFIKSEIDSRWTQEDAEKFSTLLQQFYAETNCKKFFQAHKEMYRIAEKRMAKMLSKINFKWYKEFFGEQPDGKFNLIISLLNGGSNYNSTVMLPSGKEDLFAIIGTWKTDKKGLPVYDESFLSTVIHEFGHSYSNRIVLANMDKLLQSGDKIYPDVKDDLHKVGYGSSKTMLLNQYYGHV